LKLIQLFSTHSEPLSEKTIYWMFLLTYCQKHVHGFTQISLRPNRMQVTSYSPGHTEGTKVQ